MFVIFCYVFVKIIYIWFDIIYLMNYCLLYKNIKLNLMRERERVCFIIYIKFVNVDF